MTDNRCSGAPGCGGTICPFFEPHDCSQFERDGNEFDCAGTMVRCEPVEQPALDLDDWPDEHPVAELSNEIERLRCELDASRKAGKAIERQSRRRKETADSYQRIGIRYIEQRDAAREERDGLQDRLVECESGWKESLDISSALVDDLVTVTIERDDLRLDLERTAGECLVDVPKPGTDMAKMLTANRILREERDKYKRQTNGLMDERDDLRRMLRQFNDEAFELRAQLLASNDLLGIVQLQKAELREQRDWLQERLLNVVGEATG